MPNLSTQNYALAERERMSYLSGNYDAELFEHALRGSAAEDTRLDNYEVSAGFPEEDCLQDLIDDLTALAKSRVTKSALVDFLRLLEERQSELSSSGDYGLDELNKLKCDLNAALTI